MRVLIAQDDAALASFVRKGLEAGHDAVDVSGDGEWRPSGSAGSLPETRLDCSPSFSHFSDCS
jgi:hypothetical protein